MTRYDVLIRNGTIYDGSGAAPFEGDLAIGGDTLAAVGPLSGAQGALEIDARGLAVAPGFINMLSHAQLALLVDGRSQSDIRQGVTLEVLGEGQSAMGPLNEAMKRERLEQQGDVHYEITWTTLGEYLDQLDARGVSCNVASFVGASVVRINVLGYVNRPPTPAELQQMRALVQQAMAEGAVGMSSALIYSPDTSAGTEELIALAEGVSASGGLYISHIRNESTAILDALDEFITIARRANVRSEVYHLKVSGEPAWPLLPAVIAKVEGAQRSGLPLSADMYTYTASSTGIDASLPSWAHEGGHRALVARLLDPDTRARVKADINMTAPPDKVLIVSLRDEALKSMIGKTLAEVARVRGRSAEDTLMDLIVEDDSRVGCVFFTMSEENVRREIALPWVSFGSDGSSRSNEGVFLRSSTHPRAYGNFARLLGRYVRDERIIPLQEAIRRLTLFPATNLRIERLGALREGWYADVVVFDPATIQDHATYEQPQQYATGVQHVFVNGVPVIAGGEHTGGTPGRVVRGPGWKGNNP